MSDITSRENARYERQLAERLAEQNRNDWNNADRREAPPRPAVRNAPDAPACSPVPGRLPALPHSGASMYFGGAPKITYTYGPLTGVHGLRIEAAGIGATATITDPQDAYRLLLDLEQAASSLRRRLDFPEDA